MRVEKFSLFFPPTLFSREAGRDRVRDRRDPRGRLREDQRDEPGRGPPRRGPHPGLLRPAGVEADRGDRRRPGDEPGAGLPAAVRLLLRDRGGDRHEQGRRDREGLSRRGHAASRATGSSRSTASAASRSSSRSRSPRTSAPANADQGLQGRRARRGDRRARRARADVRADPDLRPVGRAHAARLRVRRAGPARRCRSASARRRPPTASGSSPRRRSSCRPG